MLHRVDTRQKYEQMCIYTCQAITLYNAERMLVPLFKSLAGLYYRMS